MPEGFTTQPQPGRSYLVTNAEPTPKPPPPNPWRYIVLLGSAPLISLSIMFMPVKKHACGFGVNLCPQIDLNINLSRKQHNHRTYDYFSGRPRGIYPVPYIEPNTYVVPYINYYSGQVTNYIPYPPDVRHTRRNLQYWHRRSYPAPLLRQRCNRGWC